MIRYPLFWSTERPTIDNADTIPAHLATILNFGARDVAWFNQDVWYVDDIGSSLSSFLQISSFPRLQFSTPFEFSLSSLDKQRPFQRTPSLLAKGAVTL